MRQFLRNLVHHGKAGAASSSRAARSSVQLGVEVLDERILLTANPFSQASSLVARYVPDLQPIQYYQPPMIQTPDLSNQSVVLRDQVGNTLGTLAVTTEHNDGTFVGTFNGTQVNGSVTAFSIQFGADWGTQTGIILSNIGLPVVQTHHVGYSGSIHWSGSGYATNGTLDQTTARCFQDVDVCTYIAGTRMETVSLVSGAFSHS